MSIDRDIALPTKWYYSRVSVVFRRNKWLFGQKLGVKYGSLYGLLSFVVPALLVRLFSGNKPALLIILIAALVNILLYLVVYAIATTEPRDVRN